MTLGGFTKDSAGTICRQPPVQFSLTLVSAPDGSVTGHAQFHGPPYTCDAIIGKSTSAPEDGTFTFSGDRTNGRFFLIITGPVSGTTGALAGFWPDNQHFRWDVPIVGTSAQTKITGIAGGTLPGRVTLTVDLSCSDCAAG
jgi:hypothetical protein